MVFGGVYDSLDFCEILRLPRALVLRCRGTFWWGEGEGRTEWWMDGWILTVITLFALLAGGEGCVSSSLAVRHFIY